jgi:F420-dependent oxidoreductase-like protein
MIEIAVMVEGQNGLNWPRWQRLARVVEEAGYAGLYRSDHYTNANAPDIDSLEAWTSLTWLASHTERLEFGPLVSPVSFRHPTMLARMAAAVDDLSGGRLTLGLGAGWQEREHHNYGWELLEITERFRRFREGLEAVTLLLRSDEPVNYEGEYFPLNEAILLPRPARKGGPPILVGGNGPKRTLPLAARYADEWNGVYLTPEKFGERSRQLDELLIAAGRQPGEVRRSVMAGVVFGRDRREVDEKVSRRAGGRYSAEELRDRGLLVGTGDELLSRLQEYESAGLQRIMLQWLDLDDLDGLTAVAEAVLG